MLKGFIGKMTQNLSRETPYEPIDGGTLTMCAEKRFTAWIPPGNSMTRVMQASVLAAIAITTG